MVLKIALAITGRSCDRISANVSAVAKKNQNQLLSITAFNGRAVAARYFLLLTEKHALRLLRQERRAKTSPKFIFSNVNKSWIIDFERRRISGISHFSCFDIRLQNVYDDVWWSTPLINESQTFLRWKDFFPTSSRPAMPHGVDKSIETLNTFSHLAFGLTTLLAPLWEIRMQNYLGKDEKRK